MPLDTAHVIMRRQLRHIEALVSDLLDTARIERGKLSVALEPLELAPLLAVSLESARLAADELERVFELFVQGAHGEQRARGLGVGLAQVRGLLDALGGALSVHSDGLGCGATFTVRLPRLGSVPTALADASAAPRVAASRKSAASDAAPRALRILLAEDHRDTRVVLRALLSRAGHHVDVADSAAAAWRIVGESTEPFDVLLTDLHLPNQNGAELGRSLRASGEFSGALVALTGRTDVATVKRLEQCGFAAHLAKPVSMATLLACLARVTAC